MATDNDKITQQPAPAATAAADDGKKAKAPSKKTKEDLEKENAALQAELAALKAAAAEAPKSAPAAAQDEEEREEIFVPKGYANDEPFLLVGVNGVTYQLPKGKSSKVPKFVADEFRRSQKAQAILDDHIEKMTSASN